MLMKTKRDNLIQAKRACITICVLLAFVVAFLLFVGECRLAEMYECLNAENGQMRLYYKESFQLLGLRNNIKNLAADRSSGRAAVTLLLRQPDSALMQNAYPLIKQFGYTGSFMVTGDTLPGTSGGLSLSDYGKLISAGWRVVLGGDGGADLSDESAAGNFRRYITDVKFSLAQQGFAPPQVYYLEQADAAELCLQVLAEQGIRIVIQGFQPELQSYRYTGKWWHGMFFCGSATLQNNKSKVQESVYYAGLDGGAMVVTTRRVTDEAADDALDCSLQKLRICLEWFRDAHSEYGFHITGFDGLYSEKYSAYEKLLAEIAGYDSLEAYIEELDGQLSDISYRMADLMSRMYASVPSPYGLDDFVHFCSTHSLRQIFTLIRDNHRAIRYFRQYRSDMDSQYTNEY